MTMGWLVSTLLFLSGLGTPQDAPGLDPGLTSCTFSVRENVAAPTLVGPEDITSRVRVLTQPDSPVAFSRLDFNDAELVVAGEYYTFSKGYAIELVNLSDKTVRDTIVMVHVMTANGGSGGRVGRRMTIAPGRSARILRVSGHAQGTAPRDEVTLLVGIQSVEFDDCVYKPAMALPTKVYLGR
jgi:hypothetical protein